ncbi:MAG: hypothetical protein ACTSU3_07735 [Candidatus Thorarchaeota archaeon]
MNEIRVALLAPEGFEIPEGFTKLVVEDEIPDKVLYVTEWFQGIKIAKEEMNEAAQFYNDREIKFLFFRELRNPSL